MSSAEDEDHDEVTLCEVNAGPGGEEQVRVPEPRGPPTPRLGRCQLGLPRGHAQGGGPGPRAPDFGSQLLTVGEAVLCDPEGLWGISAGPADDGRDDDGPDLTALLPVFPEESGAAAEPPQGGHRSPSPPPPSCWDEESTRWQGLNSVVCARAPFPPDLVEVHPSVASPGGLGGSKGGRDGRASRTGFKGRLSVAKERQRPSAEGLGKLAPEPDGPDDFSELQRAREGRGGSRAAPSRDRDPAGTRSPEKPRDAHRRSKLPGRENLIYVPGSMPPSPPRRVPMLLERQAVGGGAASPGKKLPNVVVGKGRGKAGHSAVSLETTVPLGTSRSVIQEKKSLGAPSKSALGRVGPSWSQRTSAATPEPPTFPPIPGAKMLGRSERYSLVPLPSKQPKHTGASGRKSGSRKTRDCEQVAGEDDTKREPSPKVQASRLKLPGQSMRFAEGSGSGSSLSTRAQRAPGISQVMVMSQGDFGPGGAAPSGHQEQLECSPGPEALSPGGMDCPRCAVLLLEVDRLKKRIADLETLADRLQDLLN